MLQTAAFVHERAGEVHAGLLEQETWAMAQVPAASQLTVDDWAQQAETLKSAQARSRPSSLPSSRGASDTGDATLSSCVMPAGLERSC